MCSLWGTNLIFKYCLCMLNLMLQEINEISVANYGHFTYILNTNISCGRMSAPLGSR
jgi:hypothetical protein